MTDKVNAIFELLDVEPNEEFKIKSERNDCIYIFDESLNVKIKNDTGFSSSFCLLSEFICGELEIIKLPKITPEIKIVFDYYKLCGFSWIAKDKSGELYAYKDKCCKYMLGWSCQDDEYTCINYDIPFIKWEDEEPYYIGE